MASGVHGKTVKGGALEESFPEDAQPQPGSAPPQSTLAAELVEGLPNESRRAKPDEVTEIKRLCTIIEQEKDKAGSDLEKTHEERLAYNHILFYVCAGPVLDVVKTNDPFADFASLQLKAQNTLSLLKLAVQETPDVLKQTTDGNEFLLRGPEPLWLWFQPRLLALLGRSKLLGITSAIEDFFHFTLQTVAERVPLWDLGPGLLQYFQASLHAILEHFQSNPLADMNARNSNLDIQLPPDTFLRALDLDDPDTPSKFFYKIRDSEHAIRHAISLFHILKSTILPVGAAEPPLLYRGNIAWLMDVFQPLFSVLVHWSPQLKISLAPYVQTAIDLAEAADDTLRPKAISALALICGEIFDRSEQYLGEDEFGLATRKALSLALLHLVKEADSHRSLMQLFESRVVIPAVSFATASLPNSDLWVVSAETSVSQVPEELSSSKFVDVTLRQQVGLLGLDPVVEDGEPAPKRRKLVEHQTLSADIVEEICRVANLPISEDICSLEDSLIDAFPKLTILRQCRVIELISFVPCATDNTLGLEEGRLGSLAFSSASLECAHCSIFGYSAFTQACDDAVTKTTAYKILEKLVKSPGFRDSRRPRVYAMVRLQRMLRHTVLPKFRDLEQSILGQWCVQSLRSSIRELRIGAGRALAVLLDPDVPDFVRPIARGNQNIVLDILKLITDEDALHLHETCILAWGQAGRVVSVDHLNLILIKLVEYLGYDNSVVSAMAVNEILNIATYRGITPLQLFAPYWENMAVLVVKDLVSAPQTTRLVAETLQLSIEELLCLLQKHALPWLVLAKNLSVIEKIAEARGEKSTSQPCIDSANFPSIIALLLIQDVPDVEEHAMELLCVISPKFKQPNPGELNSDEKRPVSVRDRLAEILRVEPLGVLFELFKASGGADERKKALIRKGISILATRSSPITEKGAEPPHIIERFLEKYTLGLVSRLSERITDIDVPIPDRRRCLRAMEEMIRVCRSSVTTARSQISACLLSALGCDELRSDAFSCWSVMIMNMDEMDVPNLLDTTLWVITHHWTCFDDSTKQQAQKVLDALSKTNGHDLVKATASMTTFNHLPDLAEHRKRLGLLSQSGLTRQDLFRTFCRRLRHDHPGVIEQALTELLELLRQHQDYIQASALAEQPKSFIPGLTRSVLDCAAKYNGWQPGIMRLCAECMGIIGCLDSNRMESNREQKRFVVSQNFMDFRETADFVCFMLENVLVKAFLSTTDTKFLSFLSYAMQELLAKTGIKLAYQSQGQGQHETLYKRWRSFNDITKEILTPFLTSEFIVSSGMIGLDTNYPIFHPQKSYETWLKTFVLDLLRNPQNPNSAILFPPLCRLIKVHDPCVSEFLLPYVVLHAVIGSEGPSQTPDESQMLVGKEGSTRAEAHEKKTNGSEWRKKVMSELKTILEYQPPETATHSEKEEVKLCYEAVFRILDYFKNWLHIKKSQSASKEKDARWCPLVEEVLSSLDPELVARRAIDCGQYARALLFLEPHIESRRDQAIGDEATRLMRSVHDIYTQIDDPDGLDGISACMKDLGFKEQALSHRKAGRWTAAQTWYEIQLAESPDDVNLQLDLLTCLEESGQYDNLLSFAEGIDKTPSSLSKVMPFVLEASWATGRWQIMEKYLRAYTEGDVTDIFNIGIADALLCLKEGDGERFQELLQAMRDKVASSMTLSATSSFRTCHDVMLKCHVLEDLEMIANAEPVEGEGHAPLVKALERRLEVLGAYVSDKQYVLGVRRAAMELMRTKFGDEEISSSWLATARLARKSGSTHQSFNAVLRAQQLGDSSAVIEYAKLFYKDGQHRKAIQLLQRAIDDDLFNDGMMAIDTPTSSKSQQSHRNLLKARAHLLLAKWLDSTGQTHAGALRSKFQEAAKTHPQWEKGHYYLGRHYKKVLESEKALSPDDQSDAYLTGETAKLVIENYLRSLNFGTKYVHQTLPRILDLWLELGTQVDAPSLGMVTLSAELQSRRRTILHELYKHFNRHLPKMPAYIFYTALPQIVARIAHPNQDVFRVLEQMIIKVVEAHPRQAIWSLFSFMTGRTNGARRHRGQKVLDDLRAIAKRVDETGYDLKQLLKMGEKLAEQLLLACNKGDFQSNRTVKASITRDLNFNHKCTPCPLVVPIETCLTATLPTLTDNTRKHKAFSGDVITIDRFLDDVLVLGSLAKPRKLTARGSNGQLYGLLIKPKDDLRTDQRLMEFNGLINRSLKRDTESSKRQLYIRTYAVTPLNEECGIIEWVDGLKTLRDILLGIYKTRNITPNYGQIAELMKQACTSDDNLHLWSRSVLGMFPDVLPEWFISQFPDPSAWFAARLRYTRSCAVMSMVGTILGLGDRHGENVLLEEGNGGVFHVDFNCLFDKGLTFAQPEKVPFRLTHNMIAAMGIYRYEGPFRNCSELTLKVLRQQEETLMTILEAFIHDPTLDLQRTKKRTHDVVKLNPTSVVESIKRKVRGLLPHEKIPLGVEGQVEELIKQATDPKNLAAMYIGWCPFL
ncbi:phosphatidyl inositol 3-kinase [Neurospora tetrasperma FGSC 2508]|uniref:non-specific serine/threonine protein kinase n=1 Tax=Neurospora tetrasperma (strain FGSC 2508 / ATCC MYA-4615 / P0657) TaxID=510951 RepID=F8N521_NEUT8|nr:phosphatidyl inositol 3-kinase [Neurospora tetrasperma FGSC 2508]EGO53602.1 phosphatidyl inositol 3-kinase [Neurospora tetrasperma FGSC 2508]